MNNLKDWIADLRERGCTIRDNQGVIQVDGRAANWDDFQQVRLHRTALTIAAAGTHPEWWNHIVGRPTRHLHLDDIPTAHNDPDAFACARCAQPASHLTPDLLAWCDNCKDST